MALNDAFRSLTEELQADHAQLSARISGEKLARERAEAEVLRLRGLVNSHIQREASLKRWAERSGLTLPL